jgi:hypothetical protein
VVLVRPGEIHPQEHLGPVGRLGPTGTGTDRQDRGVVVVLTREQECRALSPEVLLKRRGVAVEIRLEAGVSGFIEQLQGSAEVVGAREQTLPCVDLGTEAVGLAKDLLGGALVVPESGFDGQRVELRDASLLRVEVKGAPRSTGSVRPDRGWRTGPPSSGPADPGAGSDAAR